MWSSAKATLGGMHSGGGGTQAYWSGQSVNWPSSGVRSGPLGDQHASTPLPASGHASAPTARAGESSIERLEPSHLRTRERSARRRVCEL